MLLCSHVGCPWERLVCKATPGALCEVLGTASPLPSELSVILLQLPLGLPQAYCFLLVNNIHKYFFKLASEMEIAVLVRPWCYSQSTDEAVWGLAGDFWV